MTFLSTSLEDTARLAEQLAKQKIHVLALSGDLGAGKTTFAGFYAKALGIGERISSPTFSIIKEYHDAVDFIHMDLYRIQEAEELLEIGFEDYLQADHLLIEWPDVARSILPEDTLYMEIRFEEDGRIFSWEDHDTISL